MSASSSAVDAPLQLLARQLGEPALDLFDSTRRGGREMHMPVRVSAALLAASIPGAVPRNKAARAIRAGHSYSLGGLPTG